MIDSVSPTMPFALPFLDGEKHKTIETIQKAMFRTELINSIELKERKEVKT